jgi:hypothetical protein
MSWEPDPSSRPADPSPPSQLSQMEAFLKSNAAVLELIGKKIAEEASDRIELQSDRLRKRVASVSSLLVLALLGVFSLGYAFFEEKVSDRASEDAKTFVESEIAKLTEDELAPLEETIEEVTNLLTVINAMTLINSGDSFSNDSAQALLADLKSLNYEQAMGRASFVANLRQLVLSFLQADRVDFVESLRPEYAEFLDNDLEVSSMLLQNHGFKLLSFPGKPGTYSGTLMEKWNTHRAAYIKAASVLQRNNNGDSSLFFDLAIATMEDDLNTVSALQEQIGRQDIESAQTFVTLARAAFFGGWTIEGNPDQGAVKARAEDVISPLAQISRELYTAITTVE